MATFAEVLLKFNYSIQRVMPVTTAGEQYHSTINDGQSSLCESPGMYMVSPNVPPKSAGRIFSTARLAQQEVVTCRVAVFTGKGLTDSFRGDDPRLGP